MNMDCKISPSSIKAFFHHHSGGELFELVADEEFQLTEGQVGTKKKTEIKTKIGTGCLKKN